MFSTKAEVMRIMKLLFTDTEYDYWEGDKTKKVETRKPL